MKLKQSISAASAVILLMTSFSSGLAAQTAKLTDPYRPPTVPGVEWCLAHLYLQVDAGSNPVFLAAQSKRGMQADTFKRYVDDLEAADPLRDLSHQGARRKKQFIEQQLVRQFNKARTALGQPADGRSFAQTLGSASGKQFSESPLGKAYNSATGKAYGYTADCIKWIDEGGLSAQADTQAAQAKIDDLRLCAAYYGAFAIAGERDTPNQRAYAERYVKTLRQAGAAMGQDPRAVEEGLKPLMEVTIMQMVTKDRTLNPSGVRSNMLTVRNCDNKLNMGERIEPPALRGVKS